MPINCERPSLQILPVEILHRIYDCLDVQTILFSLRHTCQRLKAVVNNYNRCILDLKQLSKFDFQHLSRLSDLRNIISLTLSGDDERFDQIKLFISLFNIKQFTSLQILKIFAIQENQLKDILKRVDIHSLVSFSLSIAMRDPRREDMTPILLSSIFIRSNLHKLELNIHSTRMKKITWLNIYTIEYLRLGASIDFGELCKILNYLPRLRTLILNSLPIIYVGKNQLTYSLPMPFQQVVSLTIEVLDTNINDVEQFLLLTPSLAFLKLVGIGIFSNAHRWEQFIQKNLSLLKKFEFFFTVIRDDESEIPDIESIIELFQTTFWIENKKWFVICEYNIDALGELRLYSIPICISSLNFEFESNKISLSTFPDKSDNNASITNNATTLTINFGNFLPCDQTEKKDAVDHFFFRKVEKLELEFNFKRPPNWVAFISTVIDPKIIRQLKIKEPMAHAANTDMFTDITDLLKKMNNVSSLNIYASSSTTKVCLTAKNICSMTPTHVKHLTTSIKDMLEAVTILQQLNHLSTAQFFFDHSPIWNQLIYWLKQQKIVSAYHTTISSIYICLRQNNLYYRKVDLDNKQIQLIDNHDIV